MKTFFKDISLVPKDYWPLMIMLFVMKMGQFMFLPFLAIHLSKVYHMQPALIGLIVGVGPFAFGLSSLPAGMVIDKYGMKMVVSLSLLVSAVVMFFFFLHHSVLWLFIMSALTGMTRAFFDVGVKSYGMKKITAHNRHLLFSLRAMTINSAAGMGPVVGAYLTTVNVSILLNLIGLIYLVCAMVAFFMFNQQPNGQAAASHSIYSIFKNISSDSCLLLLIFISIIYWMMYAQLDSTLAQYLSESLNHGIKRYSMMLAINAIGCVALQLLILQFTKNCSDGLLSKLSMILLAAGYLGISLSLNTSVLATSAILIVFAEIIFIPLSDSLLLKMAPQHLVASYYGALGLSMLGLGLGPMVGGIIYQYWGGKNVFVTCAFISLALIFLYAKLFKSMDKNYDENASLQRIEAG